RRRSLRMIRAEQEFHAVDNRADDRLIVSSTHPRWSRLLKRLERRGLARRTRTITATEDGERKVLGGEWEIDRGLVALRLAVRRKATPAQKAAGAKAAAARFRRETNAGALVRASGEARDEVRHVSRVKDKENIAGAIIEHEEERNEAVAIQA